MRPLIAAEPMLRAPSPEIVSESTFGAVADCVSCDCATFAAPNKAITHQADLQIPIIRVTLRRWVASAYCNACCRLAR